MTEKKLDELLSGKSGGLADLVRRAQEAQSLTERLRGALPREARPHLVSASRPAAEDDPTLVLIADSSTWASRIRFCADEMLAAARSGGVAAERCRVLVRPDAAAAATGDGP